MLSALSLGGFTMGSAGAGPAAMDVSLDDMIKQVRGQPPPLGEFARRIRRNWRLSV